MAFTSLRFALNRYLMEKGADPKPTPPLCTMQLQTDRYIFFSEQVLVVASHNSSGGIVILGTRLLYKFCSGTVCRGPGRIRDCEYGICVLSHTEIDPTKIPEYDQCSEEEKCDYHPGIGLIHK